MSSIRWTWSLSGVAALGLALSAGSCSSGSNGIGAAGPGTDGGSGSGSDATATCTSDAQCISSVPPTTPANCATGKCNAVQGVCEYVAKDEDGDGHAAANCKSTSGVPVQDGDDCNDQDPNLYPGHPESCTPTPDGGAADASVYCPMGQVSCLPDGTASACSAMCEACKQGSLGCAGAQPQTCPDGTGWKPTGASCAASMQQCLNGLCVACTPGSGQCILEAGTLAQTCDSTGTWATPSTCPSGMFCSSAQGSCAVGCYVSWGYFPTGAANPSNECQQCNPATSTTMWSNVPDGTPCSTGHCTAGNCG